MRIIVDCIIVITWEKVYQIKTNQIKTDKKVTL